MNHRTTGLTDAQQQAVARVLVEESVHRRHVLVSLSGAHAYGFPSPDSDVDVKAVHLEDTAALLGFPRTPVGAERLEVVDGVEVDYSSNELGGVLQGVLKGNGNYLERFLSGFLLGSSALAVELETLVQAALSRRVARHYAGFATQQRLAWDSGGRRSAKKLLYVLRTLLTGTHLLRAGVMETDVRVLLPEYGLADGLELVAQKARGEKAELPEALASAWASRLDALFEGLARAEAASVLPVEPAGAAQLEARLVAARLELVKG